MRLMHSLLSIVLAWGLGAALAANAANAPTTYPLWTLDKQSLVQTQQKILAADPAVLPAYQALQERATKALVAPYRSVVNKTLTPPSGSKNDYMSMGPYWWPNPNTPNGLPYVQRDGQRNPESHGSALDADNLQGVATDSLDLALMYRFTEDLRYADKAAAVIRAWFLTPATRMNPHLRYAQSIPGIVEGRGLGIIDTRDLWKVIDAAALIHPALSPAEMQALRDWFAQYAQWLSTSANGKDEAAAKNNHGMFFDVQLALYWAYTGETARARQLVFDAQTKRFAAQFDKRGWMPLELARTKPYHYHTFTLEAVTRLALYGQRLQALVPAGQGLQASDARCRAPALDIGCPLDLWHLEIDGKSLQSVLQRVAEVVVQPGAWAFATSLEPTPYLAPATYPLALARAAYPAEMFAKALALLHKETPDSIHWLLWPAP